VSPDADVLVHTIDEPGRTHAHLGVVAEPRHLVVSRQRLHELGLESTWLEGAVAQTDPVTFLTSPWRLPHRPRAQTA
jgi:hypothetical protein